ncbi:Crp/Fnr family transcriptional regulator [Streptomyces sp. NPDC001262]|uniref:Crp/Fnr family transcriptional regulator n=1 Tax=Streptomyces TaxID=1883 RepID=UPI0036958BCA
MTQDGHGGRHDWQPRTFMARLPEDARRELLAMARTGHHDAGELLMMQGDMTDHVLVLGSVRGAGSSACAKISSILADGTEGILGIRVSGDVVGEAAAVRGSARSATVTCCSPVRVHVLARDAFLGFLDRHPVAWRALLCMTFDRLDAANRRRLDFAAFSVVVRLARVLVELVERHGFRSADGHEPGVHLSQAELGRLIGAREDAVGLAMRQLKRDGLVVTHYCRVTVTDLDGLRSLAQLP